jgi:hypothetical protein
MSSVRPWARWFLERRMKWVLILLAVLLFPIHLLVYLAPAAGDAFASWRDELRVVKNL